MENGITAVVHWKRGGGHSIQSRKLKKKTPHNHTRHYFWLVLFLFSSSPPPPLSLSPLCICLSIICGALPLHSAFLIVVVDFKHHDHHHQYHVMTCQCISSHSFLSLFWSAPFAFSYPFPFEVTPTLSLTSSFITLCLIPLSFTHHIHSLTPSKTKQGRDLISPRS